jgi:hypothetical protein
MLRLSDFYYKSNISFSGTGLGRQFHHGFTSVRPSLAASSAVVLTTPVVAIPTPLVPHLRPFDLNLTRATGRRLCRPLSYLSTYPPGRQLDHRSTGRRLYRPLSHLTYARLNFFNLTRATGRRYTDPSHTPLTPVCLLTAEPRLR